MSNHKGESRPHPTVSAGGIVEAIMESWKALARHGDDCEKCSEVVAELREIPDDWLPFYDQCCAVGQELFGAWADARQGMVEQFKDSATRRGGGLTQAGNSFGNMMLTLQQRRKRLGMVGLSESEAHVRTLALEGLPTEAFNKLLAIPSDEHRENEIRALVNAQRRKHVTVEIYPSGRSAFDDRIMYRWRCACGEEAAEDCMDAETAKAYWGRHAGLLVPAKSVSDAYGGEYVDRTCRWCHKTFRTPRDSKDKYCGRECAREHWKSQK